MEELSKRDEKSTPASETSRGRQITITPTKVGRFSNSPSPN